LTLRNSYWILILLASLALAGDALLSPAQTPEPSDTLRVDSLRSDTTVSAPAAKEEGVDTVVHYSADEIDFDILAKVTVLKHHAVVTYKDMKLEAGRIEVDWNAQQLMASPLPDTTFRDSARTEVDTVIISGKPHFIQGADDFSGEQIAYNMKTRIGRVLSASTEYQEGFYRGQQFKRIASDVIIARYGDFTSCELDTPHYHFSANELKIIVGKRVIARPVFMYFDDVPVLAMPYGIFPQQKGRTSGILVPVFGETSSQGRSLRDIGYYWAPSDYIDVLGSIDYYERFGILGRARMRYARRYTLDGHTDFAFDTQRQNNSRHRNYAINSYHNQLIDQNTRLSVDASYVSSQTFNENVGSVQDLLNQQLRSNATLNKSWDNSPWTSSLTASYTEQLRQKTWSASLPSFRLSHRSGQLFPPPKAPRGIRGAVAPKELEPPWYRAFTWGYYADYINTVELPHRFREEGLRPAPLDINGHAGPPTVIPGTDSLTIYQRDGMSHNANLSATARVLRYVNLNPRLNVKSGWVRRVVDYRPVGHNFDRQDDYGLFTRTTFDLGSSATTKIYGTAVKPFGIGASFRHVLTPSTGFTYRPDFSDAKWGYYKTVRLPDGRNYTFDRFTGAEMPSNVGGTPAGLSELFSFGLEQLFQMKTGDPDAEEGTQNRYDLLSWTMNTGVDIKKDSLRWSDLSSSLRTSLPGTLLGPVQGVAIDVTMAHSFYRSVERRRIREFYWEKSPWYAPLDLLNTSVNLSFSLNSETIGQLFGIAREGRQPETMDTTAQVNPDSLLLAPSPANLPPLPQETPQGAQGGYRVSQLFEMPLSLRMGFRHARDYETGSKSTTMTASLPFSLTTRWDIQLDYSMDLERKQVTNAYVTVTRDLHCWEASLQWSPIGYRPGYYLRIGLRSPQLHDVKIERRRGGGFGRGF
jgi:lipopolysaccharide assembly outer membrane protein LptD (OstA)